MLNQKRGVAYEYKNQTAKIMDQPSPFTPGLTKGMVREHAYRLYRDKLPDHPLTLENWVLAEKDLVNSMEAEDVGVAV
jgi:hypothetical protein